MLDWDLFVTVATRAWNKYLGKAKALVFFGKNFFGRDVFMHPSVIMKCPKKIEIGKHVGINKWCFFNGAGGIKIGNGCFVSHNVSIMSEDHGFRKGIPIRQQKGKKGKVVLEGDNWIGCQTLILKGVKIGKGAVVGANSTVTRSIPANEIWAGNPAKFIKKRK